MPTETTATVSVVIPALNEEQSIGFVVGQMPWDLITECIVVNNGSADRTVSVAAEAGARVVESDRGYGAACMAGVAAASDSDIIVFLDGDGSDVVAQLPDLLRPLQEGHADFVIGSRLRGKREPGSMLASQVLAGRMAGLLIKRLYGIAYTDMGPFRAIRHNSLIQLDMKERTYGWNLEMQMRAAQKGLRIVEIPVDYRCRFGGTSKVSGSWRGSLKAIARILHVFARLAWSGRGRSSVEKNNSDAEGIAATGIIESNANEGGVSAPAPPKASIRLEKKHPLAIRWMHWLNFPVLFTMIWSGLLIYWGDSDNAYQHPHQVYRIGLGTHTLFRFFPTWFWTWYHAPFQITKGLGYHFFFMWLFAINGLLYVVYTAVSGEWRFLLPTRRSFGEALHVVLHDLHLRTDPLPHRKFNGAQQIAYTSIILMGLGSLLTGLAIYKPTQAHWLTSIFGGYETARWLHFWLTIGYCGFFLIHIGQVIKAGWNNFRAMLTGYEIVPQNAGPYTASERPTSQQPAPATDIEVKQASRVRTRRSLLVAGTAAAAGFGFYKWLANSPLSGRQQLLLRRAIQANAALSRAVFDERGLAPVYAPERALQGLRFNGIFGIRDELIEDTWRLQFVGIANPERFSQFTNDVTHWKYEYRRDIGEMPLLRDDSKGPDAGPARGRKRGAEEAGESASGLRSGTPGLLLTMADIRALPHVDEITEFKCIEGWSQIVRWGGVRLADLIAAYPPALTPEGRAPRYVYMETPNGDYYCGYDMNACTHPQSLLVYEMSGKPIDRWHGAPLRLHMPIKYGYKQIKRIGLIAYSDLRPDDYWTKLGYDWYAGL